MAKETERTLHETLALMLKMHEGVNDWTGLPYATHPVAVMLMLPPDCSEDDRHIALLHDVVEDCEVRLAEILGHRLHPVEVEQLLQGLGGLGYSDYVVQGVRLLSHNAWKGLTYMQQIEQIASSGHRGAALVKLADNTHNTDPARIALLSETRRAMAASMSGRYERSKAVLRAALGL